jgi:hypothetical protein
LKCLSCCWHTKTNICLSLFFSGLKAGLPEQLYRNQKSKFG